MEMGIVFDLIGNKRMRRIPKELEQYDDDYLIYCVEKDQVITRLEQTLHITDDPQEIIKETLKTACMFYGGDWSGVLDIDLDTDIWSAVKWYRIEGATDKTVDLVRSIEDAEMMPTWLNVMETSSPIVLPDVTSIKESNPEEYRVYERLGAHSVMASPYAPLPTGFLVIRNPSRYLNHPEALFIFAYVIHRALAQISAMEREEIIENMSPMDDTYDVTIHFFRDLEIHTAGGSITEQMINSPKSISLIAYLLLKPDRIHSPREIFEQLNPGEDFDGNTNSIRGAIYRFSTNYAKRTGQTQRLIVHEGNGYRLNPELKVTTDIQQFETHLRTAETTKKPEEKLEALRKAVDLYRGPVFFHGRDQMWLNDIVSHYEVRYIKAVDALMHELEKTGNYQEIARYATIAHVICPGNGLICYWLILSSLKLSGMAQARKTFLRLREDMIPDEIEDIRERLRGILSLKDSSLDEGV